MSRIITSKSFIKIKSLIGNKANRFPACSTCSTSCSGESSEAKKKTFNTPHAPKDPPENYNPSCVEHEAFEVPDFIPAAAFRPFTSKCETLGPGADKCGAYKNPEYHAYHRYSFVTLQADYLNKRHKCSEEL